MPVKKEEMGSEKEGEKWPLVLGTCYLKSKLRTAGSRPEENMSIRRDERFL